MLVTFYSCTLFFNNNFFTLTLIFVTELFFLFVNVHVIITFFPLHLTSGKSSPLYELYCVFIVSIQVTKGQFCCIQSCCTEVHPNDHFGICDISFTSTSYFFIASRTEIIINKCFKGNILFQCVFNFQRARIKQYL